MKLNKAILAGAALALFGILYALAGLTVVDPGEVAIKIKQFGSNRGMQKETLDTGTWWIDPVIYDVVEYDTRYKQYTIDDLPAQTKDGQPIKVDISLEIGLADDMVPKLHEKIGRNYFEQVVYPATRSATRNNTGTVLSDEIYTGQGRQRVQQAITDYLRNKLDPYGIKVSVNLRDVTFTNPDFVETLERKAAAAQTVIIAQRKAEQAKFDAERIANIAEGEKQKRIKSAEADREERRLKGEGDRLEKEETAKGNLALAKAEAEGIRLKNKALMAEGGERIVQLEWAKQMGPNIKVYAVPTGAPGTAAVMDLNGVLKGAFGGMKQ